LYIYFRMQKQVLHIILFTAFMLIANLVFAQPANLPDWDFGNPGIEGGLGAPIGGDLGVDYDVIMYSLPSMSILDIEGTSPSLTLSSTNEAGEAINETSSNNSWINYTSIAATSSTYKVTAAITGGTVPTGTILKTVAATNAGAGNGTLGVPGNQITLLNFAQDLITGIGSSYTSDGVGNGHQLTYNWSVIAGNYASLEATSGSDIIVTYTITAE